MSQKLILGGRMGDLIHQTYVVKHTPGGPHDLYITDRRELHSDGFLYPLERTIEELRPVLMWQDYVRSVQVYDGPVTENVTNRDGYVVQDEDEYINLNMWRRWVYSASWTNLLARVYNVPVVGGAWMKWPNDSLCYNLSHKSNYSARHGDWAKVSDQYRNGYPFVEQEILSSLFSIIASCSHFTGEQSLPLAIAHALDVPRIGVLNEVDAKAYIGEELIHKKFKWVL